LYLGGLADLLAVHAGDGTDLPGVPAPDLLQRLRDLPDGGLGPGRVDGQLQEVAVTLRAGGEPAQRVLGGVLVTFGAQPAQLLQLLGPHTRVVDLEDIEFGVVLGTEAVLVHADHRLPARVDPGLRTCGGLLDAELGDTGVDRPGHAARGLDLLDVAPRPPGEFVGEPFNVRAATPRVDDARGAGFLLEQQLRVARDPGTAVGR